MITEEHAERGILSIFHFRYTPHLGNWVSLLRATILTITRKTVAISFLTSLILTVSAAATPLPRWQITLTDGSRIVVDPQSHALQLASKPLGPKLAIPISAIRGVEPAGDRGVIVTYVLDGARSAVTFAVPPDADKRDLDV